MRHILFVSPWRSRPPFWLAPAFHVLPQHKKTAAEVLIVAVFFAIDYATQAHEGSPARAGHDLHRPRRQRAAGAAGGRAPS